MITFGIGILILLFGYLFYSKYVVSQFEPDGRRTPSEINYDGVDFIPMNKGRNAIIHLLNIAGIGPILGAIQGILFGPVAFILIPLGCVLMGGVHDYFAGMMSARNNGAQITTLVDKYLGHKTSRAFIFMVSILLLLVASVFVYTSGDLIAERFFNQTDFSISNPIIIWLYAIIAFYYIFATMFPIDKIIGKLYPYMCLLLLIGTGLILIGFFTHGIDLREFSLKTINLHPKYEHIIPMFFMTVSCGLLSGFHSTQATIISRTIKSEYDGKVVFYGMMCVESLIAMIWAAGAMHVYTHNLVPTQMIGTVNVINIIADNFVPIFCTFIITLAVVILPITSGDTALRGLRIILAEAFNYPQKKILNRLVIITPLALLMIGIIIWAKGGSQESFFSIWKYFTLFNQLIAIPIFIFATFFLYKKKKNYFITLIPGVFYIFITMTYLFNSKICFGLNLNIAKCLAAAIVIIFLIAFYKRIKKA